MHFQLLQTGLFAIMVVASMTACNSDSSTSPRPSTPVSDEVVSEEAPLGGIKPSFDTSVSDVSPGFSPAIDSPAENIKPARAITVNADGSSRFTTISAAIAHSQTGDTIFVYAGDYVETHLTLPHSISLIAADNVRLTVDIIDLVSGDIAINGFNITTNTHHLIAIENKNVDSFTLKNNVMTTNVTQPAATGLLLRVGQEVSNTDGPLGIELIELNIIGNTVSGFTNDNIMALSGIENITVSDNIFKANKGTLAIRGVPSLSKNASIINNYFQFDQYDLEGNVSTAIEVNHFEMVNISFNTIEGVYTSSASSHALRLFNTQSWSLSLTHNIFENNLQGLWVAYLDTLSLNSVVSNNLWPQVVSSDGFVIRTNTNGCFQIDDVDACTDGAYPENTVFYESSEVFLNTLQTFN